MKNLKEQISTMNLESNLVQFVDPLKELLTAKGQKFIVMSAAQF
jgi:hypothetical protein